MSKREFEIDTSDSPPASATAPIPTARSFLSSILLHVCSLILAALITIPVSRRVGDLRLIVQPKPTVPILLEEFSVRDIALEKVGADGSDDHLASISVAPRAAEVTEISPPNLMLQEMGEFVATESRRDAIGIVPSDSLIVRGSGGTSATSAAGAIDRITHEILLSLEQRPTLVIWLLDQSPSIAVQRAEIRRRIDRIYEELGHIRSAGHTAFRHGDEPLLSSVISFGAQVTVQTPEPTASVRELQQRIAAISDDDSGIEMVFTAVQVAVDKHRRWRQNRIGKPARNVLVVIFTDEVGDDQDLAERAIDRCRRAEIPVYVVGVPAPFGQEESLVKWVDPDPRYDQSPQWGRVQQGPESALPEVLRLRFVNDDRSMDHIDSGFGPYALTRLCVETGGIYFTVHPNRRLDRPVSNWETETYAAHLQYFFADEVMRKYRPDYVSANEFRKRLQQSRMRQALVTAARASWINPLDQPRRRFVFEDEAQFARELTEAQKEAARLTPQIDALYQSLRAGEDDRNREESPRWQAGFDLAIGRILAAKVRTELYNAMLAQAKTGLTPQKPENNTWTLQSSDNIEPGTRWEVMANQSRDYLTRVMQEHADTPWALLAKRELQTPLGWRWRDSFTEPPPPQRPSQNNGNERTPRDDQRQMLDPPKPSRPIPRL